MGNLCCFYCFQSKNIAAIEPLIKQQHDHDDDDNSRNNSATTIQNLIHSNGATTEESEEYTRVVAFHKSTPPPPPPLLPKISKNCHQVTPPPPPPPSDNSDDKIFTILNKMTPLVQTINVKSLNESIAPMITAEINYKKVRTMSKIRIKNAVHFYKSVYDAKNERVLVCDVRNRAITEISAINNNSVIKHNPNNMLRKPVSVCLNNQNNLILYDQEARKLLTVNSTTFKRAHELLTADVDFPLNDLAIDKQTDNIYACDKLNSRLVLFDKTKTKPQFIRFDTLKNFSPTFIHVHGEKIYVIDSLTNDTDTTSSGDYTSESQSVPSSMLMQKSYFRTHSAKSIHIVDKKSKKLLSTIKPKNWFNPVGLFIDSNENIITTAYGIDKQSNLSTSRYLYTISQQDGKILNRANLYFDEALSDVNMVNSEKILLISKSSGIYIYEFENGVKKIS